MNATRAPWTVGRIVGAAIGGAFLSVIVAGTLWAWYSIFTTRFGPDPVPTCVCPLDDGRPPSRQPTESDYYSTPPGVNYERRQITR